VKYLVDSDVLISVLQGDDGTLRIFRRLAAQGVSISAITYMEAAQGLLDQPASALAEFDRFLIDVPVLPIDQHTAFRCASLRRVLADRGGRVRQRGLDLLIAATALEHRLTLVTRNVHDYGDIPGLILFDAWS